MAKMETFMLRVFSAHTNAHTQSISWGQMKLCYKPLAIPPYAHHKYND